MPLDVNKMNQGQAAAKLRATASRKSAARDAIKAGRGLGKSTPSKKVPSSRQTGDSGLSSGYGSTVSQAVRGTMNAKADALSKRKKRDVELREASMRARESRTDSEARKNVKPANPFVGAEDQVRFNREHEAARSASAKGLNTKTRALAGKKGKADVTTVAQRRADRKTQAAHKSESVAKRQGQKIASGSYKGKYFGPDEFKGDLAKINAWKAAGKKKSKIKKFAK